MYGPEPLTVAVSPEEFASIPVLILAAIVAGVSLAPIATETSFPPSLKVTVAEAVAAVVTVIEVLEARAIGVTVVEVLLIIAGR